MLMEAIYGENGITSAKDEVTFNNRLSQINDQINSIEGNNKFIKYFTERLLPTLRAHVIDLCNRGKIKTAWTYNN